jgi:hypothetical protein
MLFTSFVRGFLDEKEANMELKKRPNAIRFLVTVYKADKKDELDFGYIKYNNEVLVNIYNVFRVEANEFNLKTRKVELLYGILPILDQQRTYEEGRTAMSKEDLDLTRNIDFIEDLMGKVDGQATLLQLSGYYKDSLEIYDKKVDFIRKTNES